MNLDYYERKLKRAEGIYKICFSCLIVIFMFLVLLLLTGCKTKKSVSEKTDTQDSVRIEYREKVVKVPVIVEVEVPVEQKEKMTKDSTSHLETSFAVSDASMIWIDGVAFLRHSLENKPQKIQKQDTVPVVEKEKTVWKTRRVTYTKTVTLEKKLSWWDKTMIYCGYAFLVTAVIFMIYLCFRFVLKSHTLQR